MLDRIEAYLAELARRRCPKVLSARPCRTLRTSGRRCVATPTDGRLSIDNNVSERTLRHQADWPKELL